MFVRRPIPFKTKTWASATLKNKKERSVGDQSKQIDFLRSSQPRLEISPPKKRRHIFWLYFFVFLFIGIAGFSTKIIISSSEASRNFAGGGVLSQLKNLFINRHKKVDGAKNNRINVLLLGVGGPGHEGPYLTDTVILASLRPDDKDSAMISIPRDLYVTSRDLGGVKINSIYALGNSSGQKNGGKFLKEAIEDTFGIDIHYYAMIDFGGFVELIDVLGGVKIDVERSFCDNQFPDANYQTQNICFQQGPQYFDGLRALKFARSRHGNAGEGSDFARARRQQKIILAVKEKLLNMGVLLRPDKVDKIIQILGNSIETDMEIWELVKLAKLALNMGSDNAIQYVIDDAPSGELRATIGLDGAFLLVPKDKNQLKSIAQNIFTLKNVQQEGAKVVVQNGTKIPGLAQITKSELEKNGFEVIKIENANTQTYLSTVIYDLSHGSKKISLEYLANTLKANISSYIPANLWRDNLEADFLIIIGQEPPDDLT